jgi:hypothetical protein
MSFCSRGISAASKPWPFPAQQRHAAALAQEERCWGRADQNGIAGTHISTRLARCRRTGTRTANGWEHYLQALESASPVIHAIGVTDYCVTRSYELAKAAKEQGRLKDCSPLFPNIELRLSTGTVKGNFVNIHLLVSPDDPNHVSELNRFLGRLVFSGFSDKFACTPDDLRRLGRLAGGAALDDEAALRRGAGQFKVSLDNLLESYRDIAWAQDNILLAVSANADVTVD